MKTNARKYFVVGTLARPDTGLMLNGWPPVHAGDIILVNGRKMKVEGISNRGDVSIKGPDGWSHVPLPTGTKYQLVKARPS